MMRRYEKIFVAASLIARARASSLESRRRLVARTEREPLASCLQSSSTSVDPQFTVARSVEKNNRRRGERKQAAATTVDVDNRIFSPFSPPLAYNTLVGCRALIVVAASHAAVGDARKF